MESITTKLKQLRLTGMANTLHARNQEACANQMSYDEFLGLLVEDERLAREQKQYERRYKQAAFKGHKTLESYDFKINPKINQSLIRDLSTCRFIREGNPVIIEGPCGTGKTHIAQALGHCALQSGFEVICTTQSKLAEKLQAAKALQSYQRTLKNLVKADLLIIDDFGLKPLRTPEDEYLHELVAERSEIKSTLITSNLTVNEWLQAFPNQLLGVATIDRLKHNAYMLHLDGKSYRTIKELEGVKS